MSRKGNPSSSSSSSKHWLNANDLAGFVTYTPNQQQQQQQQQRQRHHHNSNYYNDYYYYYGWQQQQHSSSSSEGRRYYKNRMIGKFSHTYRLLVRYDDNNSNKQQQHDRLHEENTEMLNDRLADPDYLLPWKYVVGVDITVWDKSSLPICPICLCTADVPRIPECGHVMCLSCALRYLQDYRQCCVCNVAITLRELKPVRMEIMDGKPRSGDIITFNLCEVVDGICRPFDADTLQKSFNHKCGYDDKKNKIQIPPRMGRDFGWRYSRVVNVGDDDNNDDEVRILLYRELKRLNNRIRDEEWVDDLECMGVYMARDHVLKQLQDESLDHHDNADDHDRNDRGCWGDDADDNGILIPDTVTNAIIDQAEERRKNDHHQQQHAVNTNSSDVNTTTSTSNDAADHPHPSSSSSSSSNAYFYQLSYGGGHVYLDPLWFKCLMVEYTGKPDAFDSMYLLPRMIRCRVVSIQDVAIDDTSSIASRKKYRSLAHLVHGSTASIVDVDFIKPTKLSHATIEALKPQIDRKYKYRKEQRRKAHKEDKLKIEAEDRIHKEEFTRLISTAPTVHSSRTTTNNNNSINDTVSSSSSRPPQPTTIVASSSMGRGIPTTTATHRMVTTGRLTPEEEALNSEEELEREFAPPPPSSSRYYDGFDVAEAFDRVITTGSRHVGLSATAAAIGSRRSLSTVPKGRVPVMMITTPPRRLLCTTRNDHDINDRLSLLENGVKVLEDNQAAAAAGGAKPKGLYGYMQKYGLPFVFWYGLLYVGGGIAWFLIFEYDYVSYDYVHNKLSSLGLEKYIRDIDPTLGKLGIAIAVNEISEVIRLPFALATIAPLVKWVKRIRRV